MKTHQLPNDAPYSDNQRAWLSGFFAGLHSQLVQNSNNAQTARTIHILYGSQTGTAESVARDAPGRISQRRHAGEVARGLFLLLEPDAHTQEDRLARCGRGGVHQGLRAGRDSAVGETWNGLPGVDVPGGEGAFKPVVALRVLVAGAIDRPGGERDLNRAVCQSCPQLQS